MSFEDGISANNAELDVKRKQLKNAVSQGAHGSRGLQQCEQSNERLKRDISVVEKQELNINQLLVSHRLIKKSLYVYVS